MGEQGSLRRFTYARIKSGAEFSAYVGKGFATYAVKGYRTDADEALQAQRLAASGTSPEASSQKAYAVLRSSPSSAFSDATGEPSPWLRRVWS